MAQPVILALLDYVSRDREIEIRRSSIVRPSSVVRPSVRPSVCGIDYDLWSYCMHFFQNLAVASPGSYAQTFFSFLRNFFLRIFFVFVNMEPYSSENFKTLLLLQMTVESFETCPEFSSHWSSLKFPIFNDIFCENFKFTIAAYGEISKTSIIWITSDRRSKRSEIWDSCVVL